MGYRPQGSIYGVFNGHQKDAHCVKKKKTRSQELVLLQVIMKVISDRVAEAFAACLL